MSRDTALAVMLERTCHPHPTSSLLGRLEPPVDARFLHPSMAPGVDPEDDPLREQVSDGARFRFKSSHDAGRKRRREERQHPKRTKHRTRSSHKTQHPGLESTKLDPDEAFRESLFDALADDEGAAYWEGVYGQPIHVYPRAKVSKGGELEQMTDEEYTAYVRNRMWEKSHEHIMEERRKREEERKKARGVRETYAAERENFDSLVEQALRRGARRKEQRQWGEVWKEYLEKWEKLRPGDATGSPDQAIPWPVLSGQRQDLAKEAVEEFFRHAPNDDPNLKLERVRWHPDKMQQLFRGNVDSDVMQSVTAVFQLVDALWTTTRRK
jgi:hypothetical protein